jgi:hypothetical protein
MSEEIRKTEGPRDEADDGLTTADLAGTNHSLAGCCRSSCADIRRAVFVTS